MEYMGTKQAAEKWHCSQSTVQRLCREGKIALVIKAEKNPSNRWQIPIDAECPLKQKQKLYSGTQ